MKAQDPQVMAKIVEQAFDRILRENMQGVPILNSRVRVQTLGFQHYQDRVVGIVITPWLMNVILLPTEDDNWSDLALGHKQSHVFPSKTCKFVVNEIDDIGFCQTHSLYSPMNEFPSHEHAERVAQDFIDALMIDASPAEEDPVDEELLGQILRGEELPDVNLDDFATIEPRASSIPIRLISDQEPLVKRKFDRRSLLRGSFLEGG